MTAEMYEIKQTYVELYDFTFLLLPPKRKLENVISISNSNQDTNACNPNLKCDTYIKLTLAFINDLLLLKSVKKNSHALFMKIRIFDLYSFILYGFYWN